jgi:hypothetical protein
MSEATPRRILHLVVEGFPPERMEELGASGEGTSDITEIFQLTEASAREALKKIFAADTVAVWGKV